MEDESWDALSDEVWDGFAQQWISELRCETGTAVIRMNFTAKPELQWKFILKAVEHAEDEELSAIAAGPVEHLLGTHGPDFIDKVEELAKVDPKFARLLPGVWKHTMNDKIWNRLQAIVEKVKSIEVDAEEEEGDEEPNHFLDKYHEESFKNALESNFRLLGSYGEDFMVLVERRAAENPGFARMLTEIQGSNMDQVLWLRLQAIGTKHQPPED